MIDGIDTVIHSNALEVEPAPANMNGAHGDYFEGVLKTENQLVGILNLDQVLSI